MKPAFVALVLVCQTSCAIAETKKKSNVSAENSAKPDWQATMRQELEAGDFSEAWGLFSYSDMEDRGQTIVYKTNKKDSAELKFVAWNSDKVAKSGPLAADKWHAFKKVVANDNLTDVEGFDGVKYTYVHLVKTGKKIEESRRLVMSNPSTIPTAEAQAKLVSAFIALQK